MNRRNADGHELPGVRRVALDDADMREPRGVKVTSKPAEIGLPIRRKRDGVGAGRNRSGEVSALAGGVDDLRRSQTVGQV
jgi:hypothetical protein